MSEVYCSVDRFAYSLEEMLNDVESDVRQAVFPAAQAAGKYGAKKVRKYAAEQFEGDKYRKSWTSNPKKTSYGAAAEIGSSIPGLPHLLEKGHATLGGGRVPGRPHVSTAADETFDYFEEVLSEEVGRAL